MADIKFKGTPVFMNGQDYYFPSLDLQSLQANMDIMSKPGPEGENAVDFSKRWVPVLGMAIRRNYPDVTDQNLWEWLDLSTLPEAVVAVRNASGMRPAKPGEAAPA